MPRKEWRLLLRDLSFYVSGDADVGAADWIRDPWIYPLDWSYQLSREDEYFAPKDAEGIPLREFPAPIGVRYLPSRIATYGLAHFNRARETGDASGLRTFRTIADWLVREGARHDGRYLHDIPVAGIAVPWISCIAQGEAASALTRAHHVTGDATYLDAARRAVDWLMRPEDDGGLASRLPDGRTFVEEYPGTKYRHVLNGCLYAAMGVSDLVRAMPNDERVADFYARLIDGVGANLGAWDAGGWSAYDYPLDAVAPRNLNTMTYQALQVVQLRYLAHASGDERLRRMADQWNASARALPARLGALRRKVTYRLAARW